LNFKKYKETGNKRAFEKAKYNYNIANACMAQLENPPQQHRTLEVKNSFNSKKETTYGIKNAKLKVSRFNKPKK